MIALLNFEILSIYNVTNCKNKTENHVDKRDWSNKIEFVGEETAEWADWPSKSLEVWVRKEVITRLLAKSKPKLNYENK